jgi:hypothetical protein
LARLLLQSAHRKGDGDLMAKRRRRRNSLGEPTKKDFQAMADVLCRHGASDSLVGDIAHYFGSQNPRFRSDLFIRATKACKR